MDYKEYFSLIYQQIPEYVYEGGISVFFLGTVLLLCFAGAKKRKLYVARLLLLEYIALIYSSTVIFRKTLSSAKITAPSVENYEKIFEGGGIHIHPEMFINVMVFALLGILICVAFRSLKWWQVLIAGCGISVSIELLQYVLRRGTTEATDVFHNTLGCLIGIGVYKLISITTQAFWKKEIKEVQEK